jgi:transglutaminase-like putative cysteine protease
MATTVSSPTRGGAAESTFRYTYNVFFQDGLWLTGTLAGLLFLTLAASLDAAEYVPRMGPVIPVAFGAIAMSLLMAFSRFDSFFAFSHGMFTGLAWILYLMAGLVTAEENRSFLEFGFPELQANVYFVLYRLLNWTEAAFSGRPSADNYMFIFEICFLVWWLTYLGMWSIFRHGYTWRAIIPAGIALLINTYYAEQLSLAFLIFFAFIALILLVRTNLAEQQVRWRAQRTYFSQDIGLDFMRTGFTYTLLVLLLAWLAPGLGRSPTVRDWITPLNEQYETLSETVRELYDINTKTIPTAAAFGNSLTLGGERNVTDSTVFTAVTTRGRYWRAVAFDTYNGRGWQNTSDQELRVEEATVLPIADWQMRDLVTQTITLAAPTGNVIFGAPDIVLLDVPVEAQVQPVAATLLPNAGAVDGDVAPGPYEFSLIHARRTLDPGMTYSLVSRQTVVTERALREAGTDYPQMILDKYLQLPDDFSPNVVALAQEMIAAQFPDAATAPPAPYAQAKVIEQYLRTIAYDDAIPAPPADQDPIEYFLFDLQRGYCDYYATAMATMLRSLGIPARTVSGYAEGLYDEDEGYYTIREVDAHTWVEVYFPTYGWIEFEPTAGESGLLRPSGEEPVVEPSTPITNTGAANQPLPTEDPFLQDPMAGSEDAFLDQWSNANGGGGLNVGSWRLWAILTPLLLILGIIGMRFMPGFVAPSYSADLPPILYERLQRWAARLGLRSGETETPYEQSRRFGRALPAGRPMIQQIVHEYVLHRFAPHAAGVTAATAENPLGRAWQTLEPLFWRAWLRRFYWTKIRRRANPFALRKE